MSHMAGRALREAIEICAIRASNTSIYSSLTVPQFEELGIHPDTPGAKLARLAWRAVYDALPKGMVRTTEWLLWAEAHALLEEGWKPGDPVYVVSPEISQLKRDQATPLAVNSIAKNHNAILPWFPKRAALSNGTH